MEKNKTAKRNGQHYLKKEGLLRKVSHKAEFWASACKELGRQAGIWGQQSGQEGPCQGPRKEHAWHIPGAAQRLMAGVEGVRGKERGRNHFHSYSWEKKPHREQTPGRECGKEKKAGRKKRCCVAELSWVGVEHPLESGFSIFMISGVYIPGRCQKAKKPPVLTTWGISAQ